MGFARILNQHQEQTSKVAAEKVLATAADRAEQEVKLAALIDRIDPLVKPAMAAFVAESNEAGYHSEYHFEAQEGRCWWSLKLITAPGEQPRGWGDMRSVNECSALLRMHSDGMGGFEWHVHGCRRDSLTSIELNRPAAVDEITQANVEEWLEAFGSRMLELSMERAL